MNLFIYNFLVSFSATLLSIPLIIEKGKKFGLLDVPNKRKIHSSPTVRIGGVSIFFGFLFSYLIGLIFYDYSEFTSLDINNVQVLLLGATSFFLLGFFEDLIIFSPFLRLIIQFSLAFILWIKGLSVEGIYFSIFNFKLFDFSLSPELSLLFTCFFIVGVINSFNWMDGLDGLGAGIAIIFFLSILFLGFENLTLVSSLIGSLLAFLIFNLKGSTLMMGDGGSYLLGFLISAMLIISSYSLQEGVYDKSINIVCPLFLLLIPLLDMARVIFVRLINGKSIFYPDNIHIHYLCLKAGLSKKNTLVLILLITVIFSIIGITITI